MNVILRDVSRLDRLITDISRASRVDNEMASESATVIDLRDLVASFVEARQATSERHQLVAETGDAPALVAVHDGRIVQVLDNLLGNAVSFAPEEARLPSLSRRVRLALSACPCRIRGPASRRADCGKSSTDSIRNGPQARPLANIRGLACR